MARQMKDSGIEWIGFVPEDWDICRLKDIASIYNGNSIKDEEKINYEDPLDAIPYIATKDIDVSSHVIDYSNGMYVKTNDASFRRAPADSTLMCIEGGSAGRKIAFTNQPVCFINKLCCFNSNVLNNRFLYYYLSSPSFAEEFKQHISGLIGGVSISEIKNFGFLLPSDDEQHRIADFLDRKCAEIDAVIECTKATIEEYKKLKQAIITEAVTKGVRGPRPMKDSGIEWIGEIPEEWNIARVGRLCFVTKLAGFEFTDHMMQALSEEGDVPIVRAQHIKMGRFLDNPTEYISFAVSQKLSRCALDQKCLIITFIGAGIGEVALFNKEQRYHLAPNVAKIVITQEMQQYISEEYLLYFLMSSAGQEEVNKIKKATAQPSLSMETIRSIKILIPESKDEQAEIAAYLDKQCAALDTLIAKKTALLTEMETYKKSLIYEYVTGKKEV